MKYRLALLDCICLFILICFSEIDLKLNSEFSAVYTSSTNTIPGCPTIRENLGIRKKLGNFSSWKILGKIKKFS